MSYESAPATKLLATNCLCCGRPLVDANSVEVGIGPDCRAKYGFNDPVGDAERAEANKLVFALACAKPNEAPNVRYTMIERIEALGLVKLAATLRDRLTSIRLVKVGNDYLDLHAPYNLAFVEAFRGKCQGKIMVKKANGKFDHWRIPAHVDSRREANEALKVAFAGQLAIGPKGLFTVGA